MYELRSTRVRTDRVLSVPGTDFQPGPQIASIPQRPWQVPGTDFQPGPQIASIPPRPWQVPAASLAGAWHRFGRSIDTLGSEPSYSGSAASDA
jgi:hypothetical protein